MSKQNKVIVESLDLNDLMYLQGTDASVADGRQLRKFFPEKTVFQNGEKILFRLHGRQFIDMKNSALRFTVKFTGATVTAGFDTYSGSILNIFRRSRIISATGKSISDVNNHNMLARMSARLYRGNQYNDTLGAVIGLQGAGSYNTWSSGTEYEFVVPMRLVSPFWDNCQLLPPQISEGLQVELFLEDLIRCGISSAGTLTKYQVLNPELICDVVQVNPAIDSAVASMSSQKMVYEYHDFVQIESTMSIDSGDLHLPLTYPLSNALEAFVTIRSTANANAATKDSFATTRITTYSSSVNDQLVWRSGSIQLPQARAIGGAQIYNILLNGKGALSNNHSMDFSLKRSNFDAANDVTNEKGWGVYFVNLRRSNLFDNSGREVSNQQSLVAEIKTAGTANNIIDMYCKFLGRIVIEKNILHVEM